ncbi:class I SAM-dependent methyltransferase [Tistrella mobilis]|uniref:class I SAM-dependent methyltransferase n=1 Tax=Tistrella mobilis TaxID=171437 RepID=UPI003557C07D
MGFYGKHILPRLTHMAMRQEQLTPYRRRTVSGAEGCVLEIGVGSGLNLPLYSDKVIRVIGVDPSAELLRIAADAARGAQPDVELIEGLAETMPLENASVDSVVVTWSLCSVTDPKRVLDEVRRVLKPNGRFHFAEHGLAPEQSVRRWQDRLTPIWRRCAGNCHLDRPVASLIEDCGFRIERLDTGYAKGPKPMAFMYEGVGRMDRCRSNGIPDA